MAVEELQGGHGVPLAERPSRDHLRPAVDPEEEILVAEVGIELLGETETRLFLAAERPEFIKFSVLQVELAHGVGQKLVAALADPDKQPLNGVPVGLEHPATGSQGHPVATVH